jgi:hypothetical protein
MIAKPRLPILLAVLSLLLFSVAASAEDSAPRYEMRGNLIIDTRTGLTYDKREAEQEREAYRELLKSQGQRVPAVPLILSDDQRRELADAGVARELELYRTMQNQLGLRVPDGLKELSRDQREDLGAWQKISAQAEHFCMRGSHRDEDPYCLDSERTRLWFEWEAKKASRPPSR